MFVTRNADGLINGAFRHPPDGITHEAVDDNDPALLAYLSPPETAVDRIVKIERSNPITHRSLRELILTIGEAFPAGKNTVFYQRVLESELAIRAERAKL